MIVQTHLEGGVVDHADDGDAHTDALRVHVHESEEADHRQREAPRQEERTRVLPHFCRQNKEGSNKVILNEMQNFLPASTAPTKFQIQLSSSLHIFCAPKTLLTGSFKTHLKQFVLH